MVRDIPNSKAREKPRLWCFDVVVRRAPEQPRYGWIGYDHLYSNWKFKRGEIAMFRVQRTCHIEIALGGRECAPKIFLNF